MAEDCICPTLPDLAHIAMGDSEHRDEKFFAIVKEVRRAGGEQWWLSLTRCNVCTQDWLVAQEERIYDEYFLERLAPAAAMHIVDTGEWPETFISYERVLRLGKSLANPCRFLNSMAASLIWTVEDLRRQRADISTAEIAALLGIDEKHASKLIASSETKAGKTVWERASKWVTLFGRR